VFNQDEEELEVNQGDDDLQELIRNRTLNPRVIDDDGDENANEEDELLIDVELPSDEEIDDDVGENDNENDNENDDLIEKID